MMAIEMINVMSCNKRQGIANENGVFDQLATISLVIEKSS